MHRGYRSGLAFAILGCFGCAFGQADRGRPLPTTLERLVDWSQVVAFASTYDNAAEHTQPLVHESIVIEGLKGVAVGDRLYFGPDQYPMGNEAFVFLRRSYAHAGPRIFESIGIKIPPPVDGATESKIFALYYAPFECDIMPVRFVCAFENEANPPCDFAVGINVRLVVPPKSLRTYSTPSTRARNRDFRWVKVAEFLFALRDMARKSPAGYRPPTRKSKSWLPPQ